MQALRDRARLGLQGDELPESLAALRGLQAIEPSLATTCNLGMVARRLGSSVEAVENLSRCMTAYWLVPADGAERALVEEIAGELAMARAAVAVVSLQAPRGAAVTIDGQPMGAADIDREYFLEPGWHTLAVTNGGATSREKVNLARGAARTIQLIPTEPPPAVKRRAPWPMVGWALTASAAAVGGGLLAAAEVNSGVALDELRAAATTSGKCVYPERDPIHCAAFAEARDWRGNLRNGALGSFVAAGALALGTTIYMVHGSASAPRAVVGSNFIKVVVPW